MAYAVPAEAGAEPLSSESIHRFLGDFIVSDPRNVLPEGEHWRIWDPPLVGIASADDPLFAELKKPDVVGPIHRSPEEWLSGARSVISYFLPYNPAIRRSYQIRSPLPSLEWVSARRNGEMFNNVLRRALIRFVERHGGKGLAPSIEKDYRAINMIPMWSERHAAYIASLGTFGIHAALITHKGVAGRIGSILTDLPLEPSPRPYTGIYQYCPYPEHGTCGACIPRCPVDALSVEGRDNQACVKQGRDVVGDHFREWGYHSCGHCLTHLPCADRIPDPTRMRPIRMLRE